MNSRYETSPTLAKKDEDYPTGSDPLSVLQKIIIQLLPFLEDQYSPTLLSLHVHVRLVPRVFCSNLQPTFMGVNQ